MKESRRFKEVKKKIDTTKEYSLLEAITTLKNSSNVKFVESLDAAVKLGVDPKYADQMVRGTVTLPHGTGKEVKVLAITKGDNIQKALNAGADYAGFEEYLEKIKGGWTEVDVIVATPDAMVELGKLGRVLGPKGLMPNPKSGTVSNDVASAVREVKAGKIEFRVEKAGIVHASIGKLSFDVEKLVENAKAFLQMINKLKPSSAKGQYIKSIYLSSTMGVGLPINKDEAAVTVK